MKDAGWSIYPNPEKWIWMNCKSISDFAGRIGVAHKTVIRLMKGEGGTTKYPLWRWHASGEWINIHLQNNRNRREMQWKTGQARCRSTVWTASLC